jgi:hypothetical protein
VASPLRFYGATATTKSGSAAATRTITLPSARPGDTIVISYTTDASTRYLVAPDGWQEHHSDGVDTDTMMGTLWRKADGSEPSSLAFSFNTGTGDAGYVSFAVAGAHPETPIKAANVADGEEALEDPFTLAANTLTSVTPLSWICTGWGDSIATRTITTLDANQTLIGSATGGNFCWHLAYEVANPGNSAYSTDMNDSRDYQWFLFEIMADPDAAVVPDVWVRESESFETTTLVQNGDFASATGWTQGAGWSIASDVAGATAATGTLTQSGLAAKIGLSYEVTYTISNYSAGSITVGIGGDTGASRSANGTYTEILTATTVGSLVFTPSTFTGDLDDVIVYRRKGYPDLRSALLGEAQDTTGKGPYVIGILDPINEGNTGVTIQLDSWTTTEDDYLHIWVHPQARHQGYWNPTEHYSVERTGAQFSFIDGPVDYVRFDGLAVYYRDMTSARQAFTPEWDTAGESSNSWEFYDCLLIARDTDGTITTAISSNGSGASSGKMVNCIFIGWARAIRGTQAYASSPLFRVHNCTFIDCFESSVRLGDVMELKNNLFINSPIDYAWGGSSPYGSANARNNVSDETGGPDLAGSGHVESTGYLRREYEFDGRLAPGANEHLRVGADLREDANLPVYRDALGNNRADPRFSQYVGALAPMNDKAPRETVVDETKHRRVYRGRR